MSYASLKCVPLQTGKVCLSSLARHSILVLAGSASYQFQVFGGLPPKLFQGFARFVQRQNVIVQQLIGFIASSSSVQNHLKKHRLLANGERRRASITSASCGTPSAPHMRALAAYKPEISSKQRDI